MIREPVDFLEIMISPCIANQLIDGRSKHVGAVAILARTILCSFGHRHCITGLTVDQDQIRPVSAPADNPYCLSSREMTSSVGFNTRPCHAVVRDCQ